MLAGTHRITLAALWPSELSLLRVLSGKDKIDLVHICYKTPKHNNHSHIFGSRTQVLQCLRPLAGFTALLWNVGFHRWTTTEKTTLQFIANSLLFVNEN